MLNYNHYLKEIGIKETDFPFEKKDERYNPDEEGFVEAEFYNLDNTFAMYIYSHLCYFKDHCLVGHPANMTMEEWSKIIDQMIESFKMMITEDEEEDNLLFDKDFIKHSKRRNRKINRGLRLFAKYFGHLWW